MAIRFFVMAIALYCLPQSVPAIPISDQVVYLYRSPLTAQFLKTENDSYDGTLFRWRNYLKKYGKRFKEIDRPELLAKLAPGVLVLASAQVLEQDERDAIASFTRAGGSLLATWATGSRDPTGQFKNYDFLSAQFNVKVRGQYNQYKNKGDLFLLPFGDGPVTWTWPAGRRMSLGPRTENILRLESDNLAAVITDYARSKVDAGVNGAIAFHESDTHRGVVFAFPESTWGYHKVADMSALLDSVMAWLQREPKVFKSAWPAGHVAAHLIEMDTEDKFDSATHLADHLEKIGVKGTFYCLTSEAIKYPKLVKDLLARGHEIAYHADVHDSFKDLDSLTQERRILAMKAQMKTILGQSVNLATGFRAPTEGYDKTTEILLRKHGILHHAADPHVHQDRLPFFSTAEPGLGPDSALVVLPRTQMDDLNFQKLGFGAARVQETLADDLELVVKSGAFGLLSVHSQNYVEGGLMKQSMGKYMDKVASYKDKLWVARGDQITAWWRQRESVSVKQLPQVADAEMRVSVKSPGGAEGLTLFITNPLKNRTAAIQVVGNKAVKFKIKALDAFRTAVVFEKLDPGEHEYLIRFP